MRLLLSVVDVSEARTAAGAGADIIDVKDPAAGALGRPAPGVVRIINSRTTHRAVVAAAVAAVAAGTAAGSAP